jgi:hypothetical protein
MKIIGLTTFALVLTAASGAQAQTVISREIKPQPVETFVVRQANGTLSTQQRVMASKAAAMPVQRAVMQRTVAKARVATSSAQKVIYRTIVREVPVVPETMVVREAVTRWVPGILPPFSYPVTTYEDREVYTGKYHKVTDIPAARTVVETPAYRTVVDAPAYRTVTTTPAYRVVDEDDQPIVRAYTTPVSYIVRY